MPTRDEICKSVEKAKEEERTKKASGAGINGSEAMDLSAVNSFVLETIDSTIIDQDQVCVCLILSHGNFLCSVENCFLIHLAVITVVTDIRPGG